MSKEGLLTERHLIKLMRDEYHARLLEALEEVEVFDKEGNVLIGRDLKVRHKKSQYEYTVDDVFQDPSSGEAQIILRMPDEPRFEPPPEQEDVLIKDKGSSTRLLDEDEINDPQILADPLNRGQEEIFMIDQEEFEREYEVK